MTVRFASSVTGSVAGDVVLIVALAIGAAAIFYRRPIVGLARSRRAVLVALRAAALAAVLALCMRPVAFVPPSAEAGAVVPVLVDVSRSMRIGDAGGLTRIARASSIAQFDVVPALSAKYTTPLFAIGDDLADAAPGRSFAAEATRSDLAGALARVRDRFRTQRLAGVVLISDGDDTESGGSRRQADRDAGSVPVFAIGVGSATGLVDREVVGIAAGEPRLADASVDVQVSATSEGFGRSPYEIRLRADGRVLDTRRVTPAADGSPDRVTFSVVPDPARDTVYTAEIPLAAGERVAENNTRSVLVGAAGRRRRLLVIAGAPGFEHSFLTRAWAADPGLDVDAVVRKGKNADGRDTFVIQAARERTQALSKGFPARREDIYAYDAIIIANMEGGFFTHEQLATLADYVAERGGGLLVMGSASLSPRGLTGTPLEPVLPVELDSRRSAVARASLGEVERGRPNELVVTREGATHPIMRLGASGEETRMRWSALPSLAASTPLGPPRPGASVLAEVAAPDGGVFPTVAVQKYGKGRSMVFGGEASWRWRMLAPAADRSYELFWRQTARWLSHASPDPVSIGVSDALMPGETAAIDIEARDGAFTPVADAAVQLSLSADDVEPHTLTVRRSDSAGHYSASFTPSHPGLYRLHAAASRGSAALGAADRVVFVGASDREFAQPRLNEPLLRRLAESTGGRYARASEAASVASWLDDAGRAARSRERRDVWDRAWVWTIIVTMLCAEWTLRRKWGLR